MNIDNIRSLIRGMFKSGRFWLALFVVILLSGNLIYIHAYTGSTPYKNEILWSSGGPVENSDHSTGSNIDIESLSSMPKYSASNEKGGTSFVYVNSGSAIGASHPYSNVIPTRQGLKKYKVQKGDTLSEIAAQFGVTIETIKYANLSIGSVISPGDELKILPVSGLLYEIDSNDTLESVSAKYRVDPKLIKKYNEDYQKLFETKGEMVILPYAKPINKWSYTSQYSKNLPNLDNYFALPARGWNWGQLHPHNAVDIAADCGEPIYAAAEGLVAKESDSSYWNEGHGNYVLIEHPNGTKTKYSHTLKNFVSKGDYVLQGDRIALIGNTGNTEGPTGCHLHFEVYGAQNPFAVK